MPSKFFRIVGGTANIVDRKDGLIMWICTIEPNTVLLPLGVYECNKCGKAVIAFSENVQYEKQPSIANYFYCPYCGEKHLIQTTKVEVKYDKI